MNLLRSGLWVVLVFATGCAGLKTRATCPAEGGAPWREVTSAHFRVKTNLNAEAATQAALELEKFRRGLLLAWDSEFDPPGEAEAIIVRNAGEFGEFTDSRIAGYATVGENGPLLVMSGHGYLVSDEPGDQSIQAHELAHYLSQYVLLRQPTWLAEGLATYLETIHFKGRTAEVILGRPQRWFLGYVREHGWLTLEELWSWDRTGQSQAEMQQHYASAWLWVHYLMNEHAERFADFQARLASAEEPRQAFEAAFRGVQDLAGGLRTYLDTGRYAILTIPLPEVSSKVEVRDLDGAEIHAIRAQLFLRSPGDTPLEQRKQKALQELAQALSEDPMNVSAAVLHSELTAESSQQLGTARALVKARPEDGRAWSMLARALGAEKGTAEEQEQALVRAAELRPKHASTLNSLAWFYAGTQRPEKAVDPAARAVKLAPGNAAILDTYAAVLFQLGRCPEALKMQRRAADSLHERAPESLRRSIHETLGKYEQSCRSEVPKQP